jgi:23S rRNA pseudouridine1911/1915/1917 synthase
MGRRALCRRPPRALVTRVRIHELGFEPVRPDGVTDDAVVSALRVPPELAGQRLDRFVQSELKRTSRTRAQLIIRVSAFDREGRRLRPSDRVKAEDHVLLWRPAWDEEEVLTALTILFEDPHLLAVDKPALVPVHPSARYYRSTVVKLLEASRPDDRLYLAHRLDRETSGVLLLSRTPEADRAVKRIFAGEKRGPGKVKKVDVREVEKVYLAIVHGAALGERTLCELPLELDPASRFRVKMRVAEEGTGLTARTTFEVVERRVRQATGEAYALVRCDLETGRQHQIRVHLAALGHPIVGDKLYGADDGAFARGADGELTAEDVTRLELPRHALHAHLLALPHPLTGERVAIESPLPADLRAFWETLSASPE